MSEKINVIEAVNYKDGNVLHQIIPLAEFEQHLQDGDYIAVPTDTGSKLIEYNSSSPPEHIQGVLSAVIINRLSFEAGQWVRKY